MKKILSSIIFLLFFSSLFGQKKGFNEQMMVIDSLQRLQEYENIISLMNSSLSDMNILNERQQIIVKIRKGAAYAGFYPEKLDAASILLQEASTYFISNQDTLNIDYTFVLDGLGDIENRKNDLQKAEIFYNRSKLIREKIVGRFDLYYAISLNKLGVLYLTLSRYKDAEDLFLKCIAIREKKMGIEHPEYAIGIHDLAVLYFNLGKFEKAKEQFLESMNIYKNTLGDKHRLYADCLNNLGGFYLKIGVYDEAEVFFLESASIYRLNYGEEHPYYASVLNSLGGLSLFKGMYMDAESLFYKSMEIRKNSLGELNPYYLTSLQNLVRVQIILGKYEKAEKRLLMALKVTKDELGVEHYFNSSLLGLLGTFYKSIGNYEMAKSFFFKELEAIERTYNEEHPTYANTLIRIANLYLSNEHFENAPALLLEAQEIIKKHLGEKNQFYAATENSIGVAYYKMKNYEKAKQQYLKSSEIYKALNPEGNTYQASLLNNLADVYHKTGELGEAIRLHKKGLKIRKKITGYTHADIARSLDKISLLYYKTGEIKQAIAYSLEGFDYKKKSLRNSFDFLSELEKLKYQQRIIGDFSLMKSFVFDSKDSLLATKVYDISLFEKGLRLNASIQTRQFIFSIQDPEVQKKYSTLIQHSTKLSKEYEKPKAEIKKIDTLEFEIAQIEKELARASAQFRSEQQLNNLDVTKLRTALRDDEIAIEFTHFRYKKNETDSIIYAACVLDPTLSEILFIPLFEENNPLVVPLNKKIKKGQIKRLYNFIDPSFAVKGDQKTLYELVWAPLDSLLDNKKRIYYSPSGLLHRLNLNAIPIDAQTIMGDQYEMYNLSSTKLIAVENEVERNQMAYIVGDVTYDLNTDELVTDSTTTFPTYFSKVNRSLRGGNWQDLPATKEETLTINNKLEKANYQVTLKTKDNATEESFKALGTTEKSPRVIHLATHGFFFPDPENKNNSRKEPVFKISENPMLRSGIILAGANHTWEGKGPIFGKEDGVLTAYEISHMNLSNTELVVLSACKTGLGDIEGSEGVYGLQRAFKKAGVKYLVMSLWEVDDEKTAVFMTAFYKNWLEKEMSIRAAFNTTQLEMKNKYANPLDWAGFVLIE